MDTFDFDLNCQSVGRGFTDFADQITNSEIHAWEGACCFLSSKSYASDYGEVQIRVNWEPVKEVVRSRADLNRTSIEEILLADNPTDEFMRTYESIGEGFDKATAKCQVTIPRDHPSLGEARRNHARNHLDIFIYEVFLIMNISSPGSCNFYKATLTDESNDIHHFELDSTLLEGAWTDSLRQGWPVIEFIPVEKTLNWMHSLNMGTRQIAKTRMERALFAILHLSKSDGYQPDGLIWLAHAIESLFDTPAAMITKILQDRVCAVLQAPPEQLKAICKQLRQFYDVRSSFVHGGLEISHPLNNDILDKEVQKYWEILMDAVAFAAKVLVAAVQVHVRNGWRELSFMENYKIVPIDD